MDLKMCDVCGTTTTPEKVLSYSVYGKSDVALDEADLCQSCGPQVMDFVKTMKMAKKQPVKK